MRTDGGEFSPNTTANHTEAMHAFRLLPPGASGRVLVIACARWHLSKTTTHRQTREPPLLIPRDERHCEKGGLDYSLPPLLKPILLMNSWCWSKRNWGLRRRQQRPTNLRPRCSSSGFKLQNSRRKSTARPTKTPGIRTQTLLDMMNAQRDRSAARNKLRELKSLVAAAELTLNTAHIRFEKDFPPQTSLAFGGRSSSSGSLPSAAKQRRQRLYNRPSDHVSSSSQPSTKRFRH